MIAAADKIDRQKFVGTKEIVQGHARLNLGFVANVFNPRLHFPTAFLPGLICIHPGGRYSNCLPPGPAGARLRAAGIRRRQISESDRRL
jgi:hypothetical protein